MKRVLVLGGNQCAVKVLTLVERDEEFELAGIQFQESTELLREMVGAIDLELSKKITVGVDFKVNGRRVAVVRRHSLSADTPKKLNVDVVINCTHRLPEVDFGEGVRVVGFTAKELLSGYREAAAALVKAAKEEG